MKIYLKVFLFVIFIHLIGAAIYIETHPMQVIERFK